MSYRAGTPLKPWTYFPLGVRAYRDVFRFTGHARRMEIAEFYILSLFVNLLVRLVADFGFETMVGDRYVDLLTKMLVGGGIQTVLMLPFFALMARRIQDFGMPGWAFVPLLPYVLFVNTWKDVAIFTRIDSPSWAYQLPALALVVIMMIAWFIPGDEGPNRYGPDPRDMPEPGSEASLQS